MGGDDVPGDTVTFLRFTRGGEEEERRNRRIPTCGKKGEKVARREEEGTDAR